MDVWNQRQLFHESLPFSILVSNNVVNFIDLTLYMLNSFEKKVNIIFLEMNSAWKG